MYVSERTPELQRLNHFLKSLIIKSESNDSLFSKIFRQNHLILILKFPNQNQMNLSSDFRKMESFGFDSEISKSECNDFVVSF